jgi:hypothetical protein
MNSIRDLIRNDIPDQREKDEQEKFCQDYAENLDRDLSSEEHDALIDTMQETKSEESARNKNEAEALEGKSISEKMDYFAENEKPSQEEKDQQFIDKYESKLDREMDTSERDAMKNTLEDHRPKPEDDEHIR